jgi:hypothetical protein
MSTQDRYRALIADVESAISRIESEHYRALEYARMVYLAILRNRHSFSLNDPYHFALDKKLDRLRTRIRQLAPEDTAIL